MSKMATTKMSSKGQIVIPEDVRKKLGLKTGDRFMVLGDEDIVILKALRVPDLSEFDNLITSVRSQAYQTGITEKEIEDAIVQARQSVK